MMRVLVPLVVAASLTIALLIFGGHGQEGFEVTAKGQELEVLTEETGVEDSTDPSSDREALKSAIIVGDLGTIRQLVAKGVDLKAKEGDDMSPLLLAVFLAGWEAVKCLLDGGAEIDEATSLGVTPLFYAVMIGKDEIALKLIDRGANVDARNSTGTSILMLAINSEKEQVIHRLIEKGADVNVQTKTHRTTALITASSKDMVEVARLLLDKGADHEVRDAFGMQARHYAKTRAMRDLLTPEPPSDNLENLNEESGRDVDKVEPA